MKTNIIDVRTELEYGMDHVEGSINIPMQEVANRIDEIKQLQGKIILVCASGNRSGMVTSYLNQQDISCENGGSWMTYKNDTVLG
jgi:rhodanese-related sulfurtransferase